MDEVQNQNSEDLQVATVEEQSHESQEPEKTIEAVDDRQDRNWKAIRERQRELEKELKLQREMNDKLLQMQLANQSVPKEVDELETLSDDEFIPTGQVKKLVQKEREHIKREAIQEVERLLEKKEKSQFMDHLRKKYSDFDEIVNVETLALLEENNPELANTIAESQDPYRMGIQSYEYIKALGLAAKAPKARQIKEVEKKLEQNAKTIQSPQAYDKRPIAQAYRITQEEKKKLFEEMTHYASQAGFSY